MIEESNNEKERLEKEKEKLSDKFKDIEQKAFKVKEKYEEIQKVYFYNYSISMHQGNIEKENVSYCYIIFVLSCAAD